VTYAIRPEHDLQRRLDRWRQRNGGRGVAVAIRLNGELQWLGISGLPELNAQFLIYSITKTFTGICVLTLVQRGVLTIKDPINKWLPDCELDDRFTIQHLLRHTSGLRDYGRLPEYYIDLSRHPSRPWSEKDFLHATVRFGHLFKPGFGWRYSNIGYMFLRKVLEKATNKSFRQCVDEIICKPLGLTRTFVAETIADLAHLVPGYSREISKKGDPLDVRRRYHPGWVAPGVAVSTTAETTLVFDKLFAGALLDDTRLATMLELVPVPGRHPPAKSTGYGLGIASDPDGALGWSYGHGGGGPGYSVTVSILPRLEIGRFCIAVFCNESGVDVARLQRGIAEVAIKNHFISEP
jgi:D-alanyl-D-alanine carboxypeptidase